MRFGNVSAAAAALLLVGTAFAHATPLSLALDVQGPGLAFAEGGTGLEASASGSIAVDIGGPVQGALLYWAGRDRPCPENATEDDCTIPAMPYKDQVLSFDGDLVTGTIIGTEYQPGTFSAPDSPINNIGYLADVTAIVQAKGAGLQTFSVADGDGGNDLWRLDGAGLLVIYVDPADPMTYRIQAFDGLDFAYGRDITPGGTRMTEPVTFMYDGAADPRSADLVLFAGDAHTPRPNKVTITDNPNLCNPLDASDGDWWDTDRVAITVPAGSTATSVQIFSDESCSAGDPASLLWSLAALRLPIPASPPPTGDEGCTPGYWKNHADAWAGTGYSPGQAVSSVFADAAAYPALGSATLLQSLQGGGGPGALGGARILLRAAVAALLNAASGDVGYPWSVGDLVDQVNAALASGDRGTMLDLAAALDADNNLGCPLS